VPALGSRRNFRGFLWTICIYQHLVEIDPPSSTDHCGFLDVNLPTVKSVIDALYSDTLSVSM
jgi:hypothetical protein